MFVAPKTWKMPNHTLTWSCQTATIIHYTRNTQLQKRHGQKMMHPLFQAVTCPTGNEACYSTHSQSKIMLLLFLQKHAKDLLAISLLLCVGILKKQREKALRKISWRSSGFALKWPVKWFIATYLKTGLAVESEQQFGLQIGPSLWCICTLEPVELTGILHERDDDSFG